MSDEIKEGDLVMVVRGLKCCGKSIKIGFPFKVAEISYFDAPTGSRCIHCRSTGFASGEIAYFERGKGKGIFLYQLKKIDPPALPESVDESQEVTA